MKKLGMFSIIIVTILTSFAISKSNAVPVVCTGEALIFTKADNADWNLAANQDQITDNVWLTRKGHQGLFNIKVESEYDRGTTFLAPTGTEWATGTTSDFQKLNFTTWREWAGGKPDLRTTIVDKAGVLHLIVDDLYLDIKFISWTGNAKGGGFSYERSTCITQTPTTIPVTTTTTIPDTTTTTIPGNDNHAAPNISANGSDVLVTIIEGSDLLITVALEPGDDDGKDADWWVSATDPTLGTFWLTLDSLGNLIWQQSATPLRTLGGALFKLSTFPILKTPAVPVGNWVFMFVVDDKMDDTLNDDDESSSKDSVTVIVKGCQ